MEGFLDFAGVVPFVGLLLHDEVGRVDKVERSAGFLAVAVDQAATRNGEDVGIEGTAVFVATSGTVEFEKGFLCEVFCVGAIAERAVEKVNQSSLPALDDAGERSLIACCDRAQAGAIDIFDDLRGWGS